MSRNNSKFALIRATYRKNRQWMIDNLDPKTGYVKDLLKQAECDDPVKRAEAQEALLFISKFNEEYYNNTGLTSKNALHSSDSLKKDCYNRTNSANRDLLSILGPSIKSYNENYGGDDDE